MNIFACWFWLQGVIKTVGRKMLSYQQGFLTRNSPANHKNSIFPNLVLILGSLEWARASQYLPHDTSFSTLVPLFWAGLPSSTVLCLPTWILVLFLKRVRTASWLTAAHRGPYFAQWIATPNRHLLMWHCCHRCVSIMYFLVCSAQHINVQSKLTSAHR